jgi:hypothetical protein
MGTTNQSPGAGDIFQSPTEAPKSLAAPEYRQQALRSILSLNRSKGVSSLSLSELALQLRDQSLRDHLDPRLEPLSLESINAAVADLLKSHELIVEGRTAIIPTEPGAPR